MDEAEKTRVELQLLSPEADHPFVFEQLQNAAEFHGQWQEARFMSDSKDLSVVTALITAGSEQLNAGRPDQALFVAREAANYMKDMQIDEDTTNTAIIVHANLSALLYELGDESSQEYLNISITQLKNELKRYGWKDSENISELITNNYSALLRLIKPIIIADYKINTNISENFWLQQLLKARLPISSQLSIIAEFSQSAPPLANIIVRKIQSIHIDQPQQIINELRGCLQSNEHKARFENTVNQLISNEESLASAEVLFRLALASGAPVDLLHHLSLFVQQGYPIAEYLEYIDSSIAFQRYDSQKLILPLLEYFIDRNDLASFLKYCGNEVLDKPNSPLVRKVVAACVQQYGTGVAAIRELSNRTTTVDTQVMNKLVIAIIFHSGDDQTQLVDSTQKYAKNMKGQLSNHLSMDLQLALYAKTHDEAIWQQLENQLLQMTEPLNFQLIASTVASQCTAYANCILLEKFAFSLDKKLHGQQKNRAIRQLIDECYKILETTDLQGFETLIGVIDPNYACIFADSAVSVLFMMNTHGPIEAGKTRHFTATQQALLRLTFPAVITELRKNPDTIERKIIINAYALYAQAGQEECARILLDLHTTAHDPKWDTLTPDEQINECSILMDNLCRQKKFEQAISLLTDYFSAAELNVLIAENDFQVDKIIKNFIAQLGMNTAIAELKKVFNLLGHAQRITYAIDFLKAGLPFDLLSSSLRSTDDLSFTNLQMTLYYNFEGLNNSDSQEEIINAILSDVNLFPNNALEIGERIRFKYKALYGDLLSQLKSSETIPQPPQVTKMIATLKAEPTKYSPQHCASLLRKARYTEDEIEYIYSEVFGELPPHKVVTEHNTAAVLARLEGIINPIWLDKFQENKWDAAQFSEIWNQGFPNLMQAQAENVQLMSQLENDRPGIIEYLHKRFGVHCFSRVAKLEWKNMFDDRKSTKQWVLVVFSRNDHNGALSRPIVYTDLHAQLKSTHTLVFCEAASLDAIGLQLMRSYVAYSHNKEGDDRKCATIIIDWHGDENSGVLSNDQMVGSVTAQDVALHPASTILRQRYVQDACPFVSLGCSTGVLFVPTVGRKLGFSSSSGPQIPTGFQRFAVKYRPDKQHIASITPQFHCSPTLTYDKNGALASQ